MINKSCLKVWCCLIKFTNDYQTRFIVTLQTRVTYYFSSVLILFDNVLNDVYTLIAFTYSLYLINDYFVYTLVAFWCCLIIDGRIILWGLAQKRASKEASPHGTMRVDFYSLPFGAGRCFLCIEVRLGLYNNKCR